MYVRVDTSCVAHHDEHSHEVSRCEEPPRTRHGAEPRIRRRSTSMRIFGGRASIQRGFLVENVVQLAQADEHARREAPDMGGESQTCIIEQRPILRRIEDRLSIH